MLQMTVQFYRRYLPEHETSEAFAGLIEALDKDAFDTLLDRLPPLITGAEPATFDDYSEVTAEELARSAGLAGHA